MVEQARLVAYDTKRKNALEAAHFQIIHASGEEELSKTARALVAALLAEDRQRADARARHHRFQLEAAQEATTP